MVIAQTVTFTAVACGFDLALHDSSSWWTYRTRGAQSDGVGRNAQKLPHNKSRSWEQRAGKGAVEQLTWKLEMQL